MLHKSAINGAWEEKGVIGMRIEIEGKKICVLWRNSPVLETTFKTEEADGGVSLILKENGLRYQGSDKDYAEIKSIEYKDGKLKVTEFFPITGISEEMLEPTENTRFGSYVFADKRLYKALSGTWIDENGYFTLTFKDNKAECDGKKAEIRLLVPKSDPGSPLCRIVDSDPSKDYLFGLINLTFDGERVRATIPVCDAPSVELTMTKK